MTKKQNLYLLKQFVDTQIWASADYEPEVPFTYDLRHKLSKKVEVVTLNKDTISYVNNYKSAWKHMLGSVDNELTSNAVFELAAIIEGHSPDEEKFIKTLQRRLVLKKVSLFNNWIKSFKSNSSIRSSKLPIYFACFFISLITPC